MSLDLAKTTKFYFALAASIIILAAFFVYQQNQPNSVAALMEKAEYTAKHGQIAYAIDDYIKIVENFPRNYEAHTRLAELYYKAGESDMAKVEYIKAIRLNYKNKYQAHVALANIYAKENNYSFAETFINQIKNTRVKKAHESIGNFYYNWGLSSKKHNLTETIRKFKAAYEHYKVANVPQQEKVLSEIENTYILLANNLIQENKKNDAINLLKISLSFYDSAKIHYEMATIYEMLNKIDDAIAEYKTAFKLNPEISNTDAYVQTLIRKAEMEKNKGDKVSAELYYTFAKKINSKTEIPINPENGIILNDVSAKCNEDIDKDILTPEITFKLRNIRKNAINYLKIKTVFLENNKPFNEVINTTVTSNSPLGSDSETQQINIFSLEPVQHVFDKHNLTAEIYISQENPDKWILFRRIHILSKTQADIPIIEVK